MSGSHTLIVNFQFNPPLLKIIGPVKEATIEKLNQVLPRVTTSTRSSRAGSPKFLFEPIPAHWVMKLDGQYCDDIGMSSMFLSVLDTLEEEGGWKLVESQAITMPTTDTLGQDFNEFYKFYFTRIM